MISAQLDLLIASRYAAGIREPVVVLHPRDVGEVMEWVRRGGLAVFGKSELDFDPEHSST